MEKKPLYVDADPDDARLQPVPPPPVAVAQSDVNQYIGEKQRRHVCEPSLPAAAIVSSSRVALRAGEARPRHALVFRRIRCSSARTVPPLLQRSRCAAVYVGNFDAGDFSGEGVYNYNSGSKYVGSWLKGKMSGAGRYVTKSGDSYEGEYRDGHREGSGTLLFSVGIQYQGEFLNGCGDGKGTLLYPSGCSYEGQFKDEMPHGTGVLSYANGCRCEGEFAKGRMHGCCKFFFPDGNMYAPPRPSPSPLPPGCRLPHSPALADTWAITLTGAA